MLIVLLGCFKVLLRIYPSRRGCYTLLPWPIPLKMKLIQKTSFAHFYWLLVGNKTALAIRHWLPMHFGIKNCIIRFDSSWNWYVILPVNEHTAFEYRHESMERHPVEQLCGNSAILQNPHQLFPNASFVT